MSHPILAEALDKLSLGHPQAAANLTMYPLIRRDGIELDYLTLEDALEQGLAEVTEVSEGGSVPELHFSNKAGEAVLLLDGEELVGAKQNRVLNLTILVAAQSALKIPVTCVERGRWAYRSRKFTAGGRALYARARAAKTAAVSESLEMGFKRAANQGEIWSEISRKAGAMSVDSATEAMADIYESRMTALRNIRSRIKAVPGQVGAAFAINGKVVGLELFDAPQTCARQLPKLIDSFAMDALEEESADAPRPVAADVTGLIGELRAASTQSYQALGLGEDLRLRGQHLQGAALVARERVVHLSAYAQGQ